MLHLKPVLESEAGENVKKVFNDIKSSLDINVVPIIFRYLANYPDFLEYVWGRIASVLSSPSFEKSRNQMVELSDNIAEIIYIGSGEMNSFALSLSLDEKKELSSTAESLSIANASLMLITVAIRESLKGILIEERRMLGSPVASSAFEESIREQFASEIETSNGKSISGFSTELLPAFEFGSVLIVRYPQFYKLISEEMKQLSKTEKYLKGRVDLEKIGQMLIDKFPVPISLPFIETVEKLQGREHSQEMLLLIKNTFPAQYPHHLLTGSVMKKALKDSRDVKVV